MSIKKLDYNNSPTNQILMRADKAYSYSLFNKNKISLKKGFRKTDNN